VIAQRELQRIDDVVANDLRRVLVLDDRVEGFECAHVCLSVMTVPVEHNRLKIATKIDLHRRAVQGKALAKIVPDVFTK
jgi:hypothetical protein